MLTGSMIRDMFQQFFAERGHTIMPSASLVPESDPTLLWIVAGMQPFKKYFLGKEVPPNVRLTDCQKCVRTNDIDEVGRTARHCTFFEMLGNFSFGDYFKAEVIPWAWEFVTAYLMLDPEKLWVSIYTDDDEAYQLWNERVGVRAERIVRLEDNFWGFGVGPCGPCSEIFIDLGPERGCHSPTCGLECDCGRYLEFWNLVFIQFNRDEEGKLTPLDKPCIDTGMGLERITSIVQGVQTNFETDLFMPLIEFTAGLLGTEYGLDAKTDMALKVIADHGRAVTFMVSDGVMPSNEGRGYIIRRILRRSLRFGKLLGMDRPFLFDVCSKVVDNYGEAYPILEKSRAQVIRVVKAEEERFQATLSQGLYLLDELIAAVSVNGGSVLPGEDVFKLYDTFGFPLEVTQEIATERGFALDTDGFDRALQAQRERARSARAESAYMDAEMAAYEAVSGLTTEFCGYETLQASATVTAILVSGKKVSEASPGDEVELILDATPFYAESGGQMGDSGSIAGVDSLVAIEAAKRPFEGITIHRGRMVRGILRVGDAVVAGVDALKRKATARNHSVTHLLHRALREVLGEHVHQSGSLVGPDRLRFDFAHFSPMTKDEINATQRRVNELIMQNLPVITQVKSLDEARAIGATALFGEKYGALVRIVSMGDVSMELCGGTHLTSTGEAGLFKITGEGGIAAGVRRIEAVTGYGALDAIVNLESLLERTTEQLKVNMDELPDRLNRLLTEYKGLEREIAGLRHLATKGQVDELISQAQRIGDVNIVTTRLGPMEPDELRSFGDMLREKLGSSVIFLASELDGDKVAFLSMVSKDLIGKVQAGALVKEAARITGGGGGGRADMAQAGGRDAGKLPQAMEAIWAMITAAV